MSRTRRMRVLLVTDHEASATVVEEALGGEGSVPTTLTRVPAVTDALEASRRATYHAVLLDLDVSGGSGLDALLDLQDAGIEWPVVVLAREAGDDVGLEAVRAGAQDYLVVDRITPDLLVRSLRYAAERQRAVDRLRVLAMVDDLTRVYNRRALLVMGGQTVEHASREDRSVAVLSVQLSGLDAINEEYGYGEGDRALVAVARLLRRAFRESDVVARAGGDEFVVVGEVAEPSADRLLERLKWMVGLEEARSNAPWTIALRAGAAVAAPGAGGSLEDLIEAAERDRDGGVTAPEGLVKGPEVIGGEDGEAEAV